MFHSIHSKLLAGFALKLAVLVASIALAMHSMKTINADADALGRKSVPAVQALGVIRNSLNTMRSTELDSINAPNAQVYKIASTVYKEAVSEADGAFAAYAKVAAP